MANEREAILAKLQAVADAYGELCAEIHRQRPWDILKDWTIELEFKGPANPASADRVSMRLDYRGHVFDHVWITTYPVI
jgi:hypothetical protein